MKYFTKNSIQKLQPGGYFITPNNPPSDMGNYPGVRAMRQRQQFTEDKRRKEEEAFQKEFQAWVQWQRSLPYSDPRKVYVLTPEVFKQQKENEAAMAKQPQLKQGRSAAEEKTRQQQKQQEDLQRSYNYQYSQLYGNMGMPNTGATQAAVQSMPYVWNTTKNYFSNPTNVLEDVSHAVLSPLAAPVAEPLAVKQSIQKGDTKGAFVHGVGFGLSTLPIFGMKYIMPKGSSIRTTETPRVSSPSTLKRAVDKESAWEQRTFDNAYQKVSQAYQEGNQALQNFRQFLAQQQESFGSTLGPQPEYSLVGGGSYRGGLDLNSKLYQPARQMNMHIGRWKTNGKKSKTGDNPKSETDQSAVTANNTLDRVYDSRQYLWSNDDPIQFSIGNTYKINGQPIAKGATVTETFLDDYLRVVYEDGSVGYIPRNQYTEPIRAVEAKPMRLINEEGGIDAGTPIKKILTDDNSGVVEVELSDGRVTLISKDNIASAEPEIPATPAKAGGKNLRYDDYSTYTGKVKIVREANGKETAFYEDRDGNFVSNGDAELTEVPQEVPIGTKVPSGTKIRRYDDQYEASPLPNKMYQGLWKVDPFGNRTTFWGKHPIFTTVSIPTALGITGHALFGGSLLNDLGWFGGHVQEGATGGNFYKDIQNNKAKENQAVLDSLHRAAEIKDSTDKAEKQRIQEEEEYWKRQDSLKNEWRNLNQNQNQ